MRRAVPIAVAAVLALAVLSTAGPEKVAFPSGYKAFVLFATVDRPDNKTVRDLYAPRAVLHAAKPGQPLPDGTVIVMEVYRARLDQKGEPVKDAAARLIKEDLTGLFVMEKRAGWGAEYPANLRNGEWEYARFTLDGKPHPNRDTKPCFECHKPLDGQDFVFTFDRLLAAPK